MEIRHQHHGQFGWANARPIGPPLGLKLEIELDILLEGQVSLSIQREEMYQLKITKEELSGEILI
jgi:hypothetical protein